MRKLLGVLALVMIAAGCNGRGSSAIAPNPGTPGPGGPSGNLEVRITDQPFNSRCFLEATIDVRKVELLGVPLDPVTGTADPFGPVAITITATPQAFDLTQLVGGASESLGAVSVSATRIDAVRITLGQGVLTFSGATPFQQLFDGPLEPISVSVTPAPLIVPGDRRVTLLLDFDVASTFAAADPFVTDCGALQSPGAVAFVPRVRAINTELSARLEGVVIDGRTGLGLPGVTVSVQGGTMPAFSNVSTLTGFGPSGGQPGFFTIFVEPSPQSGYTMTFEAPNRAGPIITVGSPGAGAAAIVNVSIQ